MNPFAEPSTTLPHKAMLVLAALGWLIAAAAMAAFWVWQSCRRQVAAATVLWPGLVAALAIVYVNLGSGEWVRRSAMGWMMGSWGARLAVQGIYTRAAHGDHNSGALTPFWSLQALAAAALIASVPALLASLNRDPGLSVAELAACGLWVIGFAGETTADRQRLRFRSNPQNQGLRCRTGLWRYSGHPRGIFESLIWIAYAIFGVVAAGSLHLV